MLTRSQRKRMGCPYGEYEFKLKNVCNQKYWNEYLQHVRILRIEEELGMFRDPPRIYAAERCKRHEQEKKMMIENAFWNDVEVVARNKNEDHGMFCGGKCPLTRDAEAAEERIPNHVLAWEESEKKIAEVKYEPADPSYQPDHVYHDLVRDLQLQQDLYAKDFEYNFTQWPRMCWLKPKFETASLELVFEKLKLFQLMPYSYRSACRFIDITVDLHIVLPQPDHYLGTNIWKLQVTKFPLTSDYFDEAKVRDTMVAMLNWRVNNPPMNFQGLVVKKIRKVEFCLSA